MRLPRLERPWLRRVAWIAALVALASVCTCRMHCCGVPIDCDCGDRRSAR